MKDNFSAEPDKYLQFRPSYPAALFEYLETILPGRGNAWDCATGNGQVAGHLARIFKQVFATDISTEQLKHAVQLPNIQYSVQLAESTIFADNFFDLITVGQAVHWFDFDRFYQEVYRTATPTALIMIIGYGRLSLSTELDEVIDNLYTNIIGRYWDKERRYVDEEYKTIPFPFKELSVPNFSNEYWWTLEHLIGYLQTWSAVKHYKKENGSDPVASIADELSAKWGVVPERHVRFPLLLRIGKI